MCIETFSLLFEPSMFSFAPRILDFHGEYSENCVGSRLLVHYSHVILKFTYSKINV